MTTEGVLINLEKEVSELENLIQNASSDEIEKLVAQNKKLEYRLKHVNMSIEEEKKFVPKSNLPDMDYSKCLSPGSMLKHAFTWAMKLISTDPIKNCNFFFLSSSSMFSHFRNP